MILDKEQEAAVKTKEKNVIVVASAGSGKTRVLTERVKYLLDSGVPAHSIVCITFTNIAADEMRERLRLVDGIGDVFIGTIHSFASSIYKESGIKFTIRTSEVENSLYKEVLTPNIFLKESFSITLERYLAFLDVVEEYNNGEVTESYLNNFLKPSEKIGLESASNKVDYICSERNIISFDELLYHTVKHFQSIGASLDYLLVDEFQDVGRLENSFIKGLNAKNNFFVGDDWQAIYGFRGGNVEIFKRLMRDNNYKVYYLLNNYRNSYMILNSANKVIDQVDNKLEKQVRGVRDNRGYVRTDSKHSLEEHLDSIRRRGDFGKWFILTRTNNELFNIGSILAKKGIPYDTFKRAGMSKEELNKIMSNDTVKLLTVHVSKGLENDNVILYGNFPMVVPSYRVNNEERRVMYVGMTRARDSLIILS